ncbi:MAG: hypothetical protein B7C24_15430 [Bacteroidetes bacterium 4572_77]|nr:MAG: hypothetical protein B7C24_15430 [Bacteroidetes bacterium 4572_77]
MRFPPILICFTLGFLLLSSLTFGQYKKGESDYTKNMKSSIEALYKANNYDSFNRIAFQIQNIAEEEDSKWIPYYHSSYAYIRAAFSSKEKFDAAEKLNIAQNNINKMAKLSPNNDEIVALQGLLYQARSGIYTGSKSAEYVKKAIKEYDHARFMNINNPRPYYLIGQILYKLPEQYGGNKENACKHFNKAAEKFNNFNARSSFSPNWGENSNAKMLLKCNKQ